MTTRLIVFGIRTALATGLLFLIVRLIANHDRGGLKGMSIPIEQVIHCIIAATIAATVCVRFWHSFPAPFLAGIAGALVAGSLATPYGGWLGLHVGLLVVVVIGKMPFTSSPSEDTAECQRMSNSS